MVYSGFRFVRLRTRGGLPIAIVNRGRTRGDELAELRSKATWVGADSGGGSHRRCHPGLMNSKFITTALRRGLHKRCPHCGEGPLFSGWSHLECCSRCIEISLLNPGDTWAFTIIGDRLPIAVMIVLIYFGVMRSYFVLGATMMIVLVALLIWTSPNCWGAGIASSAPTCRE